MRHPVQVLNTSIAIVVPVLVVLSILAPEFTESLAPYLLFLSVFIVGIPHGAVDHVVAADLYNLKKSLKGHLLFYSSYLLVMLIIGALWLAFPIAGMILFLIISIYHFGQADAVALVEKESAFFNLYAWMRGFLIIGIIIFGHPEISLPIIETAIRTSPDSFSLLYQYSFSFLLVTLVLFIITTIPVMNKLIITKSKMLFDSLLLIALLLLTHPLIGFAIYFAFWHSAGHVLEMIEFFKEKGRDVSIGRFYKMALPFTLVSFAGLGLLLIIHQAYSFGNEMVSLLFILISVLTLPHMLIVDQMFKSTKIKEH